jgi:hypothetical protein
MQQACLRQQRVLDIFTRRAFVVQGLDGIKREFPVQFNQSNKIVHSMRAQSLLNRATPKDVADGALLQRVFENTDMSPTEAAKAERLHTSVWIVARC